MKQFSLESSTTRSVVLIHSLGIVLKFPRFDFWHGFRIFYKLFREVHTSYKERKIWYVKHFLKWRLFGHYERPDSLFWYWFRGWFANINEARYFLFNPNNPLLVPTYFSLLGFVNVQPLIIPMKKADKHKNVFDKCWNATDIADEMTNHDSHAWENENFTERTNGTIALFDYGSSRAWPMVKKYGHRFSRVFLTTK